MNVTLSRESIDQLAYTISGDNSRSPYLRGVDLVEFFNQFGFVDEYGPGFPTRWIFARDKIVDSNGTPKLKQIIDCVFDARRFLNTLIEIDETARYLNDYFEFDGFILKKIGKSYKINKIPGVVKIDDDLFADVSSANLDEYIFKCREKIETEDFSGSITAARTLLEEVILKALEKKKGTRPKNSGDLVKMYKDLQKELGLSPVDYESSGLKQILSGLTSIVNGLANLRNEASDSHATVYKPLKRHAELAVNCSKTVSNFIFASLKRT